MTLDDETTTVEELVQAARTAATEHLERATNDLRLGRKTLDRYQDFLNSTIVSAESTIRNLRETASALAAVPEASANIGQNILAAARESIRLMYAAMAVIEELVGTGGHLNARRAGVTHVAESAASRSCSFCEKTDTETKLVAGPEANICASCTRLACGVLGIELSASEAE